MVVAQVQDLDVVVELEQVAQLGRVLKAIKLVISQIELPQVHVHLQSSGWRERDREGGREAGRKRERKEH